MYKKLVVAIRSSLLTTIIYKCTQQYKYLQALFAENGNTKAIKILSVLRVG